MDPGSDYDRNLAEEVAKLQRLFGGGDLTTFPEFKFTGDEVQVLLVQSESVRWASGNEGIVTKESVYRADSNTHKLKQTIFFQSQSLTTSPTSERSSCSSVSSCQHSRWVGQTNLEMLTVLEQVFEGCLFTILLRCKNVFGPPQNLLRSQI